jgi:hypothetical protein
MEFTHFQFGVKSNLLKLLQNQTYMALMVLNILWENEDDIDVINHEIIQVLMKTSFIKCWKTTGALIGPNDITTYPKWS